MADQNNEQLYVFTKEAILRSIKKLEQLQIHEHFAGYLAILRAKQANNGLPIRSVDITSFHDRYLRVIGAPDRSPYVRPFKSRGHGLELFNANVAGSYAPSSLRARGALKDVIEVTGAHRNATYDLKPGHDEMARQNLLKGRKVPAASLAAFLYRDYGFELEQPKVESVVSLFREEFGLDRDEQRVFRSIFEDDSGDFSDRDLMVLGSNGGENG